jgi:anti-sigma-K factor RskA
MSDHDDIRGLIAAVALGAATEQERADVERHAATCPDCRAELDGLRAASAGLALDVPQLDPPPGLKRRVLAAVHADADRRAPAAPVRRRPRLALWPAAAAVLAVIAIGLLAWNVSLRDGGTREISVVGNGDPAVTGRLRIADDGTAVLRVTGLPPAAAGQGYELWTIRDGAPRSEGFAARTESGELVVATADLDGAQALAITPEPRSNTSGPTGRQVVVVEL